MKTLLAFICCLVGLSALAQGPVIRNPWTTNSDPEILAGTNITVTVGAGQQVTVSGSPSSTVINQTNINLTVVSNATFNGKTTINNTTITNANITYITNVVAYVTNLFAVTEYVTNLNVTYLTNQTFYTTNVFATTVNATTNFVTENFSTNLFSTNIITTNLFATFITNNTLYTTNVFATTVNATTNFVTENFSTNLFSTNIITTNLFSTFITNQTIFTTNVFATTINTTTNISNFNITTNLNVVSNATFNSFTTLSNTYVTNITIFEAQWSTNQWNGPTNNIDFTHGTYQKYKTSTDMLINGLLGAVATNENTTVLLIDPGGADRTLYFPNSWTNFTSDKANAYVIGSTNIAIVTLSQYGQENTNVIVRIWGVPPTSQIWTSAPSGPVNKSYWLSDETNAQRRVLFTVFSDGGALKIQNQTNDSDVFIDITAGQAQVIAATPAGGFDWYAGFQVFNNGDGTAAPYFELVNDTNNISFLDPTGNNFAEESFRFGSFGNTHSPIHTSFATNAINGTGANIATLDTNGIFTAHGLVDDAFAANGVVTNDSTGLLHTTPTLPSTLLPNDLAYVDKNNAFTTASSNYFAGAVTTSTNQNQITPDFSVEEQLISTNAAFTFLAPVGVGTGKTVAQWTLVHVTNTTASAVLITSPANCHTVGTAYVTNWTDVWFNCYAQKITNAFYVPVF